MSKIARNIVITGGTSGRKWSGSVQVGDNTAHTFDDMGSSWSDKEISTSWVLFQTYTDTITLEPGETKEITISGSLTGCSGSSLAGVTSSGSETITITATATEDTNTKIKNVIFVSPADSLNIVMKLGYKLINFNKYEKYPAVIKEVYKNIFEIHNFFNKAICFIIFYSAFIFFTGINFYKDVHNLAYFFASAVDFGCKLY